MIASLKNSSLSGGGTIDNGTLTIDTANNFVGINTTSPQGTLDVKSSAANDANPVIRLTDSAAGFVYFDSSLGPGSYNGVVSSGDKGIIFSNGSVGTGSFVIAPWIAATSGIKIDGVNSTVGINTTTPERTLSLTGGNIGFQENATARSVVWGNLAATGKAVITGAEGASGYLTFSTNNTTRLTIDSSGRITMPYQPAFSARATAGPIAAGSTMPYNVTVINRGSVFNTTTYRFTAPVTGTYLLSAYDIGHTTGTTRLMLYKNGVDLEANGTVHQLRGPNAANYSSMTSFWLVDASANDYFYVVVTETQSYGTAEYSWFSGFLIG